MALTPEQLQFLRTHRLAVIGAIRSDGRPQLTPIYYVVEGDATLVVSTTRDRVKTKLLRRDPRVSLCALQEEPPFRYVTVYGRCEIDEESGLETLLAVNERMRGRPVPPEERPAFEERVRNEGRITLRIHVEEAVP